jgi:solute carrier family 35 protein E1
MKTSTVLCCIGILSTVFLYNTDGFLNQKCSNLKMLSLRSTTTKRNLHNALDKGSLSSSTAILSSISQQEVPFSETNNIAPLIEKQEEKQAKFFERLELFFHLSLWYTFSAVYNIYNKKALNCLGLPWFVATVQMGTGILLFTPLWFMKLREFPASSFSQLIEVFGYMKKVALYQTLTHTAGVIALGSGAVSFTQVVKASEPVFTAGISAIFLKDFLSWQAYATLIPICIGVAVASTTEISFSWYCLLAGIIANIFAAARGVFGKTQMCGAISCLEQLSPENYYAVLTMLSFVMLLPATLLIEGSKISVMLKSAFLYFKEFATISNLGGKVLHQSVESIKFQGILYSLYSGVLFYLYNELSFRTLSKISPVTHAISNTVKRIVIILSSVIVFNNKMTHSGIFGTCLAISGVFLYSVAQYKYKPKAFKNE